MNTYKRYLIIILIINSNSTSRQWASSGMDFSGLETLALAGAVVGVAAATGIILYSNEFYAAPVLSFYCSGKHEQYDNGWVHSARISPGAGYSLMLRKNYKHGDLELGFHRIDSKVVQDDYLHNLGKVLSGTNIWCGLEVDK